ncbi:rhodanese-like domain-containing protein [Candidatus Dependentiae bacterium]|nr:rhodanese-like domain-containing protein [Candidatus Dependentiae bacterium]
MKKLLYLLLFSTIVVTPGWLPKPLTKKSEIKFVKKERPLKTITAEQLKDRMVKEKELVVINVLSKESFENCRIKGSINVPLSKLQEKAKWNKDKKLVLYCASYECSASEEAYKVLEGLGFNNIAAYEGGIKEWKEKKFETEGSCK